MNPLTTIDISFLEDDGDTRAFVYDDRFGRRKRGFVVRWDDALYAYRNQCPHWSTPLDDRGGDVFDEASEVLVCQTHGARFDPESGECVDGPCLGDSLERLRVVDTGDGTAEIHPPGLDVPDR